MCIRDSNPWARLRALSQRPRPKPHLGNVTVPGFAAGEEVPPRSDKRAELAHRSAQRLRAAKPDGSGAVKED
eukprot:6846675-Alexandrium_andersonii.AAC.1